MLKKKLSYLWIFNIYVSTAISITYGYEDYKWLFSYRLDKQAGVYLLTTNGIIPPNSIEHMETSCPLKEIGGKVIHPFAYRVHTHELGMCYTIPAWYKFYFMLKIFIHSALCNSVTYFTQ